MTGPECRLFCNSAVLLKSYWTETTKNGYIKRLQILSYSETKRSIFVHTLKCRRCKTLDQMDIRKTIFNFSMFTLRLVKQQCFKFITKSNRESQTRESSVISKRRIHCLNDVNYRLDSDILTERMMLPSHPHYLQRFPKKSQAYHLESHPCCCEKEDWKKFTLLELIFRYKNKSSVQFFSSVFLTHPSKNVYLSSHYWLTPHLLGLFFFPLLF
jgi:hypothetical protein